MDMPKITRDEYIQSLQTGVYEIVIIKKDGSLRKFIATLSRGIIPIPFERAMQTIFVDKQLKTKSILPIYDLLTSRWKSIRVTSIVVFKKLIIED